MKTLPLTLAKELLIVEVPKDKSTEEILSKIKVEEGKQYDFRCKGSDLTEDIADGFVHSDNDYGVLMYQNYKTTSMQYFDEQLTALESFKSAVESKGFYWGVNPIEMPSSDDINWFRNQVDGNFSERYTRIFNWYEAESRNFKLERTLIFEKI